MHPRIRSQLGGLTIQTTTANKIGIVFQHVRTAQDINGAGFCVGLARVQRLDMGDFIVSLPKQSNGLVQDAGTNSRGCLRPSRKCTASSSNGRIDISLRGNMDVGQGRGIRRVESLKSLARSGGLDFAVVVKLTGRMSRRHDNNSGTDRHSRVVTDSETVEVEEAEEKKTSSSK